MANIRKESPECLVDTEILHDPVRTSKELWHFKSRKLNPEFQAGVRTLPLRPCLKHHNAECLEITSKNGVFSENGQILREIKVKTRPKWFTELGYYNIDNDSGELLSKGEYQTNEFKASNKRKILALDEFCSHYQPLYSVRQVSLLFHTFTQANEANLSFRRMLDNVKLHYSEIGRPLRAHLWTGEVSTDVDLHWHYHLCVAIDRITVHKIPEELKFEDLWGRRTGVEFVKKNVRHYMAKYFAKHNSRVMGVRSFGKSRHFN